MTRTNDGGALLLAHDIWTGLADRKGDGSFDDGSELDVPQQRALDVPQQRALDVPQQRALDVFHHLFTDAPDRTHRLDRATRGSTHRLWLSATSSDMQFRS